MSEIVGQRTLPSVLIATVDVRVTVPGYVSMKRAEAFVFSKEGWIVEKIREQQKQFEGALDDPGGTKCSRCGEGRSRSG